MGSNEDFGYKWFKNLPLSEFERTRASKRKTIVEMLPEHKGLMEESFAAKVEAILLAKSKTNMEYLSQKNLQYEVEALLQKRLIKKSSTTDQSADQGLNATKRKRGEATPGGTRRPKILRAENSISSLNRNSKADEAEKRKEQIRQHIASFHSSGVDCDSDDTCQLCGMSELPLMPEHKYCLFCRARIERNVDYYSMTTEDLEQLNFCSSCFFDAPGRVIFPFGISISKDNFCKEKNDDEYDEPWICCNKCNHWQHQICGLYNKKSDHSKTSEYSCPKCLLAEMESGHYTPSLTTAFFSAKDLKRTNLSNHIENRLAMCLKQHIQEIAKTNVEDFRIEDIFVRVVLSEKKNLSVNKKLLDVIGHKDYTGEFPYTTKLILLFQKIKGIDVCLFGMYVQEYGSECSYPNKRCAYISYLDTVKYFEPEALRTMVYHQVLIGYLDYIKQRGFTTCYLWSCPPEQGVEYIFYCRPQTQKTPDPERLRQWYISMIKKATSEGIVVNHSTFYDRFFTQPKQHNRKMTTTSLPYFDGDYWPSTIDNYLNKIEIFRTNPKDSSDVPETDVLLMHELERAFFVGKEDFMVIDLQFVCSLCHRAFLSGKYYHRKSSICESCHAMEKSCSSKTKDSLFYEVLVDMIPDTKDEDETLENSLFSNRNKFTWFCENNKYQFDTLRRAKYSTMMILHHLRETKSSCCVHKEEGVACHSMPRGKPKLAPPPSRPRGKPKITPSPFRPRSQRCGNRTARNYTALFKKSTG